VKAFSSRQKSSLSIQEIIYSLKISIADGFFATAFVTLTGTVFLPAFLLTIGAEWKFYLIIESQEIYWFNRPKISCFFDA